jgi:hypothetical protein
MENDGEADKNQDLDDLENYILSPKGTIQSER